MITYKLFRVKGTKLYPLYVNANKPTPIGRWIDAEVGEKKDETHVKSKLGALSLRPGWHRNITERLIRFLLRISPPTIMHFLRQLTSI